MIIQYSIDLFSLVQLHHILLNILAW